MKTVKLNEKSIWVALWMFFTFNSKKSIEQGASWDTKPNNTCAFKTDILKGIGLLVSCLPVFVIAYIIMAFAPKRKYPGKSLRGPVIAIQALLIMLSGLLYSAAGGKASFIQVYLMAILSMVILTVVLIVLRLLAAWLVELHQEYSNRSMRNRNPQKPKEPCFLKLMYLSWKDKLCHKIEYTND